MNYEMLAIALASLTIALVNLFLWRRPAPHIEALPAQTIKAHLKTRWVLVMRGPWESWDGDPNEWRGAFDPGHMESRDRASSFTSEEKAWNAHRVISFHFPAETALAEWRVLADTAWAIEREQEGLIRLNSIEAEKTLPGAGA